MRRSGAVLFLCLVWTAAAVTPQEGRNTWKKHPREVPGCGTGAADCHDSLGKRRHVHGPVAVETCDACHRLVNEKAHTFELKRQGGTLCTFCHDFDLRGVPVVHGPVRRGECLGCHDPHGGTTRALMRGRTMEETCGFCHESLTRNRNHVHTPVGKGECISCHTSHASRYPGLLRAEGNELCLSCHEPFKKQMKAATLLHKALEEGCTRCHDPHASRDPGHVRASVPDLCARCHQETLKAAREAPFRHSVVLEDRSCLTCHTPHGGALASLMSGPAGPICIRCHREPVTTGDGRKIRALKILADPQSIKHGPIKKGHCSGCHNSHGGDKKGFLPRTNSRSFYQRFQPDRYGLCFHCHDIRLAREQATTKVTRFRNGDRNLHFVHTNQGRRSRNCRACHSTHASGNAAHVNSQVKFGKWNLPIHYRSTATGGSCLSGCHPRYGYDREKPVLLPSAEGKPPARVPGRGEEAVGPVRWTGVSLTGARLTVPHPTLPTVLLFLRGRNLQEDQVLKLVHAAFPTHGMTRILQVVEGLHAKERARGLARRGGTWPIVLDPDHNLSGRLDIHTWPTVLVVDARGRQIARMAGAAEDLGADLTAYIDFASGRIDEATLDSRLGRSSLIGDRAAEEGARVLALARRHLRVGRKALAWGELSTLTGLPPSRASLRLEATRMLLTAGMADKALVLLGPLVVGRDTPPFPAGILRARAWIDLGRWREAEAALENLARLLPRAGEVHYLLGRIWEHKNQVKKAMAAYRKARELDSVR